jgi:hypothetical protein
MTRHRIEGSNRGGEFPSCAGRNCARSLSIPNNALADESGVTSLDRCFKLIGEKPVALSGCLHDVFIEDFRREIAEI